MSRWRWRREEEPDEYDEYDDQDGYEGRAEGASSEETAASDATDPDDQRPARATAGQEESPDAEFAPPAVGPLVPTGSPPPRAGQSSVPGATKDATQDAMQDARPDGEPLYANADEAGPTAVTPVRNPNRRLDADQRSDDGPEFHEFEFIERPRRSRRRLLAIAIAAATVIAIAIAGVVAKQSQIERDLRSHVEANYQLGGLGGVKVTANGRDLTAEGVVSSPDDLQRAKDLALAVRGVRTIKLRLTVENTTVATTATTVPTPTTRVAPTTTVVATPLPDFSAIVAGKRLTVIADAPTKEARTAFLDAVQPADRFGRRNVVANDLVTVAGAKGDLKTWQSLGNFVAGFSQAKITNVAVTITDDVMTITGIVNDEVIHEQMIRVAGLIAGDPSHVIDRTTGANRPTTVGSTEFDIAAPTLALPTTTAAPATTARPAPVVTAAPVATAPTTSPPVPVTKAPGVAAAKITIAAKSSPAVGAVGAVGAVATTRAAAPPRAAVTARTPRTRPAARATTGSVSAAAVPSSTIVAGAADVGVGDSSAAPETTAVDEPPVAIQDAQGEAAAVPIRDQIRAAIAGASIDFSEGSSELTDASKAVIGRIARALAGSTARVEVRAYTDDRGDEQVNRALTQRRATVVRAELIAQGADASRLSAVGLGAANPVASDDTPEGRRQNRRVVFVVTVE